MLNRQNAGDVGESEPPTEASRTIEPLAFNNHFSEAAGLHVAIIRDFKAAFADARDAFHARRIDAAGVLAALTPSEI